MERKFIKSLNKLEEGKKYIFSLNTGQIVQGTFLQFTLHNNNIIAVRSNNGVDTFERKDVFSVEAL